MTAVSVIDEIVCLAQLLIPYVDCTFTQIASPISTRFYSQKCWNTVYAFFWTESL